MLADLEIFEEVQPLLTHFPPSFGPERVVSASKMAKLTHFYKISYQKGSCNPCNPL